MAKNLFNATQIKGLKPKAGCKLTKYHDGEGLYLWVYDDGKRAYKRWFFRYRFNKANKPEILLGAFPKVSLAEARQKADEARELIKKGVDPAVNKKAVKAARHYEEANCFEVIAREWFNERMADKVDGHRKKVIASLEKDVFPFIGSVPIKDITAPQILDVIKNVEVRGAIDTAHRIKGRCSEIFCYAIATSRCDLDPTASLKGALKNVVRTHRAAIVAPSEVGKLLRMLDGYRGSFIVSCALLLAPLVFVRPGELRAAEWKDFDLEAAEWRFQVSKTLRNGVVNHIVPLSRQALAILAKIRQVTGEGRYVFPCATSVTRPMSNSAILAAFRRMGITRDEMTGHGWRATARTLIEEELKFPPHQIEQQLAHVVKDPLGRAYNRTTHLEERRRMMQEWADYLDKLKTES